jgi:AbrB family looped-hinge helix DNA binding protein
MKAATRLTSKGQVVIPKAIRSQLRWRTGTQLQVEALPDGAVRLCPEAGDPIEQAFGCLTEGDPLADLEAEHRAEVKADERWRRRRRR